MPYDVFVQSIVSTSARLLGQELILDTKAMGRNGLDNTQEIGMAMAGAKIIYTLCRKGVYAPPDFEEDTAFRSAKPPRATMWLEHVYGYAGLKNLANNLFYTHRGEV
jgi:microtubule-associated protein-like 5